MTLMPSPCTVDYCMPTAMYSATVGLHLTVPRMPVLQLYKSLSYHCIGSTNLSITNIRLKYVTSDLWLRYGYISKTTAYLIPLMKEDGHFRT